jgi:hypothetical protein
MRVITQAVLDMETMKWVSVESYDYTGPVDLCCGPSSAETGLAANASSLSNTMSADFGSRFASQSDLLKNLTQSLSPIASAGPSQQGMSAQELAALNSQAISSAGAAARNAKQAAGNFSAGQNNTSGLTSGIAKQINASVDSSAENNLANNQLNITKANYDQGNQNWQRANGFLNSVAGQYDPSQFGSLATSSNQNAFGEADKIQQEKNAEQQAIAGAITGAGASFLTGGLSNLGAGESFW